MKKILAPFLAAIVLATTACQSENGFRGAVRERFAPTYRTHVIEADQKAAYAAARRALRAMSYQFTSGGAAQGKIEAIGGLQAGSGAGSARQFSVSVRLGPAPTSGTEVSVLFSEVREDAFSKREGMGTTTPMQDTPLYEVFFRQLEQALAVPEE